MKLNDVQKKLLKHISFSRLEAWLDGTFHERYVLEKDLIAGLPDTVQKAVDFGTYHDDIITGAQKIQSKEDLSVIEQLPQDVQAEVNLNGSFRHTFKDGTVMYFPLFGRCDYLFYDGAIGERKTCSEKRMLQMLRKSKKQNTFYVLTVKYGTEGLPKSRTCHTYISFTEQAGGEYRHTGEVRHFEYEITDKNITGMKQRIHHYIDGVCAKYADTETVDTE